MLCTLSSAMRCWEHMERPGGSRHRRQGSKEKKPTGCLGESYNLWGTGMDVRAVLGGAYYCKCLGLCLAPLRNSYFWQYFSMRDDNGTLSQSEYLFTDISGVNSHLTLVLLVTVVNRHLSTHVLYCRS